MMAGTAATQQPSHNFGDVLNQPAGKKEPGWSSIFSQEYPTQNPSSELDIDDTIYIYIRYHIIYIIYVYSSSPVAENVCIPGQGLLEE